MNTSVIEFETVHKRFTLRHDRPRSFRELAVSLVKHSSSRREELHVLRGISFVVREGDVLGIIGENGAGKSTILNLIAHIIEPTSGRITTRGRVSTLLELGTGFHPDLTGRENIYLNGSILGFSKTEMDRKFDEIVEFSELERFIDVPLRHYSAGMYMRLGFSIAVHVEPEILLIDEVLAVGDQAFQRKCMDKINEFQELGVSIIFVSHSLDAVRGLCTKAIWLDEGKIKSEGITDKVIDHYLDKVTVDEEARLKAQSEKGERGERWGTGEAEVTDVHFLDAEGQERYVFETGEKMTARIKYRTKGRIDKPIFGVAIYRSDGLHVNGPNTRLSGYDIEYIDGEGEIDYAVDALSLLGGTYQFTAAIHDYSGLHSYDHRHRAWEFLVRQGDVRERYGVLYLPSRWEHRAGTR
jgi:ABC-type polysaccharide/polyol phosphate transport system ATPase subunit